MKRKGVDHKQAGVKMRERQRTAVARHTLAEVKRKAGLHKRRQEERQMREEERQMRVALPFVEDHWGVLQMLEEVRQMLEEEKMPEEVHQRPEEALQMREVPPFLVDH